MEKKGPHYNGTAPYTSYKHIHVRVCVHKMQTYLDTFFQNGGMEYL